MIGFPRADAQTFSWPRRRVAPAFAQNGMVASSHPLVTSTGIRTLADGGNAVDAAVASGLVAAVVMPEMCGLGGDLFALIHDPAATGGTGGAPVVTSIQGSGTGPQSLSLESMRQARADGRMPGTGPLSVTVPGMVDAYFTLLDRWGSRGFAELVEPAVDYARGHPISPVLVSFVDKFAGLLGALPATAAVFLPDGSPPAPGSVLRQPDLARTLETLASQGAEAFYHGEIAERIAAYLAEVGGALTVDDFKGHRTQVSAPVVSTYREHTVYQTQLPSQGLILLEALNIAEQFDIASMGVGTAAATHVLVEAVRLAFADRHAYLRDPGAGPSPVERLLSKDWARERAASIGTQAQADIPAGTFDDGHTTYLNVVDGNGMMVSLIQSVAANFGSGVVAGDTGVVLNNRASAFSLDDLHPNVYAPGKKPMHTLNCYLIADAEDRLVVVGGTPGGDRQPQWNLQTIVGLVDAGWDVQQTVEQPLWFSSTPGRAPADGYELTLEARVGEEFAGTLREQGHSVVVDGDWSSLSGVQVIARDPDTGVLAGGSDPRQEGLALGL